MAAESTPKKFSVIAREGGWVHYIEAHSMAISNSGNFFLLNGSDGKPIGIYPTEAILAIVETKFLKD
jgi:hypothetical protein